MKCAKEERKWENLNHKDDKNERSESGWIQTIQQEREEDEKEN